MPRDSAHDIDPDDLLRAYALGYFPMARRKLDPSVVWVLPDERGVLDLETGIRLPRKLRRLIARAPFEIKVDAAFPAVLAACAAPGAGREDTWINDPIAEVYTTLHRMGRAHSVECYEDGALVGGLYGVALGQVFCGESMFSRRDNASKIAFAFLVAILSRGGFKLLDTQFHTDHLAQFGVVKMPCAEYLARLESLARAPAAFSLDQLDATDVLQSITQTS